MNKTSVSRADLIKIFLRHGRNGLLQGAGAAGYYLKEEEIREEERCTASVADGPGQIEIGPKKGKFINKVPLMDFWMPVEYDDVSDEEKKPPDRLEGVTPFKANNEEIVGDPSILPPKTRPLVPWSRMWPFLFNTLSSLKRSTRVDEKKAISIISSGTPLKEVPFKERTTWARSGQIILDYNYNLTPLWDETTRLFKSLEKIRGKFGLEVLKTEYLPEGPYINKGREYHYKMPEQGTPVFIISDLGYYDKAGKRKNAWMEFGRKLGRAGIKPVVLLPCPPRAWDTGLTKYFFHVCWDRSARAVNVCNQNRTQTRDTDFENNVYEETEERLLSLISPAHVMETGLLRTLRYLLPADRSDIGVEMSVWNSEKVSTGPAHCELKTGHIKEYRGRFKQEKRELGEKAMSAIMEYHRCLPWPVRANEGRTAWYLGFDAGGAGHNEFVAKMQKTMDEDAYPGKSGMAAFINRSLPRMCIEMVGGDPELAVCWAKANKDAFRKGRIEEIPCGINIKDVGWILSEELPPEKWVLLQEDGETFILKKRAFFWEELRNPDQTIVQAPGSPIAEFTLSRRIITIKYPDDEVVKTGKWFAEPDNISSEQVGDRALYLGGVDVLAFAPERMFGRSGIKGLVIETDHARTAIINRKKLEKTAEIGRDRFGLYEDIRIKGIIQRFRFVPPGCFLMGSPGDEAERLNNETLHEVILDRGYWLADTACTQELWEAVTGKNPARFKDPIKPVESASWNDCKEFIEKINEQGPDLEFRLPTEAEWEYACRAGTTTPFSFGENITTDQVNYDGNYPYKDGKKGEYREETVKVKEFPCNTWGLYEMHGNVWEWCEDWYGDYDTEKAIDPKGPDSGNSRVLRGGSWIYSGRYVRSAIRDRYSPGYCDVNLGFRLARGQKQAGM